MTSNGKPILFYSNFCSYCSSVLRDVVRLNLKESFVFVCVDDKINQMPGFLDRVPTILTPDREVLTDDKVQLFLSRASADNPDDIMPCSMRDICQGMSDSFSFIDLSSTGPNPNYVPVDARISIATPEVQTRNRQGGAAGSDNSDAFDRIKAQRELEIQSIYKTVQPRY
jgi:hypothetical protein